MNRPEQHLFRAIWPITDPALPFSALKAEAAEQLPRLLMQARARVVGRLSWVILPSAAVPGSGRVTDKLLMVTAPAVPAVRR